MEEVNAALLRHPDILASRITGSIVFSQSGTMSAVTKQDLDAAYKKYKSEFAALLQRRK